jgi:hypothetical protein
MSAASFQNILLRKPCGHLKIKTYNSLSINLYLRLNIANGHETNLTRRGQSFTDVNREKLTLNSLYDDTLKS